jgi:hypothetical protein
MALSLALLIATGCQGALQSPVLSSTQSASPSATAKATPAPTASPTPLGTPTATVEITKAPAPFDVQKLVADMASGAARTEYPAVSASTLTDELTKLVDSNPAVANILHVKENLQTCISSSGEHYKRAQACEDETARFIIFANKTADPGALQYTNDLIGYSIKNVFQTQEDLNGYASFLPAMINKIVASS